MASMRLLAENILVFGLYLKKLANQKKLLFSLSQRCLELGKCIRINREKGLINLTTLIALTANID
ncbi:hypothetical protein Q9L42_019495 [Methylomarinum sp. Ch1-1]|uniref:Transposase n=1 Tax=Methylomarinum roseum TaxID=3067653 RepID=A0AAU7NU59_9GAMM